MADYSHSQCSEHIAGLTLDQKDYHQRGWTHQYIWGLDINRHVITKMLDERFGRQGFALELVEGDLYKIWAPGEFGQVRRSRVPNYFHNPLEEPSLRQSQIDFASCKQASRTRAKVLAPKQALVNRL